MTIIFLQIITNHTVKDAVDDDDVDVLMNQIVADKAIEIEVLTLHLLLQMNQIDIALIKRMKASFLRVSSKHNKNYYCASIIIY